MSANLTHRELLDVIESLPDPALRVAQRAHQMEARRLAKELADRQRWAALMGREVKRRGMAG